MLVEKSAGLLTCKSSKPEQHGPACTVMFEWRGKHTKSPMKISVDLCQAIKLPWEVYEHKLQSNDCNVSDYFKNHIQNFGSFLLMPYALCCFKATFTEAELALNADLSDHHIKCYKLLKYVINSEIHPLQTYTSKIKHLFQDESHFPSYALKIMVWNHQFHEHRLEENDTFSCVFQMLSCQYSVSSRGDTLTHPFNRNSGIKVTNDGSGTGKLWDYIGIRMNGLLTGLRRVQELSIDKYDYETCCREVAIRGCGKFSCIKKGFILILVVGFAVFGLSKLGPYVSSTTRFALLVSPLLILLTAAAAFFTIWLRGKYSKLPSRR